MASEFNVSRQYLSVFKMRMRPDERLNSRLVIAQDRHEIFLVHASYHPDYLQYLKKEDGRITANAFLTMAIYGPWDTNKADDMKDLAVIIVAMSLVVEQRM
jgi:hypothetical protein